MRLLTPKRLRENEDFMWVLADRQIDQFLADGRCEVVRQLGGPFTMLVIADLLGVPESDHDLFRARLGHRDEGLSIGSTGDETMAHKPLEFLYDQFTMYLEERRREPRDDILGGMAAATFPDGSTPDVGDVAKIASNLFAAGQETTIRLLGTAFLRIGEDPELQQRLRDAPDLIANFVEECLRHAGEGRLPPEPGAHDGGRGRSARRHHRHGAQRGRQPGSPQVRGPRGVLHRAGQRP
jgi:cytochrome P450